MTGQSALNGPIVSGLNLHSTPMNNSPPAVNQVMRRINSQSPIDGLESILGSNSITSAGSRVSSPLDLPIMNGTPLLGGGQNLTSPPILPPSGK